MSVPLMARERLQPIVAAGSFLLLAALFGILHGLGNAGNLGGFVPEFIGVSLGAGVMYLVALYALEHTADRRAVLWIILLGALVFRLQLFPLAPALSDDLHRYRWEGRVQQAGFNPYTVQIGRASCRERV